ncbi:MAG: hypothetical protein GX803_02685 [Lentisphaerae bacterium]|nr:hypothetical protein [Lentisphaerota bacterium]
MTKSSAKLVGRLAGLAVLMGAFLAAAVFLSGERGPALRLRPKRGRIVNRAGSYRTMAAARSANAIPITSSVIISAVGTANPAGPVDCRGNAYDYIEIYNQSGRSFNLDGCSLTDKAHRPRKWVFPAITLPPKTSMVLWANGRDTLDSLTSLTPRDGIRSNFWTMGREQMPLIASRVCESSAGFESVDKLSANRKLVFPLTFEQPEDVALWLELRGVGAHTSRVACLVNGQAVILEREPSAEYVLCQIRNPERTDAYWPMEAGPQQLEFGLLAGSVRIARVVVMKRGELLGGGEQDAHLNFKIRRAGEFVGLFTPQRVPLDYVTTPELQPGQSYRRTAAGKGMFAVADADTPLAGVARPPELSLPGGRAAAGQMVVMTPADANDTVRYTLDGSLPTRKSAAYAGPLALTGNTFVRARSFRDGARPSATTDRTYWLEELGPLPVMSVIMEQDDLDGGEFGLLPNKTLRGVLTEKPCHITIIDPACPTAACKAGMRIQGRSTRNFQIKQNFRFKFRNRYESRFWPEPFFDTPGPQKTSSIVAQSSGYLQNAIGFEVMEAAGVQTPRRRHAMMYVNGRPYGLYNLMDDINAPEYLEQTFGHLDLDVVKEKTLTPLKWGTMDEFNRTWGQLEEMPTSSVTVPQVAEFVDLTYLARYAAGLHYLGLGDSGQGWFVLDYKNPARKWTMVAWDLDGSFYMSPERLLFSPAGHRRNAVAALLHSKEYVQAVYAPELQRHLNHVFPVERWVGRIRFYRDRAMPYLDLEWEGMLNQKDDATTKQTLDEFKAKQVAYYTTIEDYLRQRTELLYGKVADMLRVESLHEVTVRPAGGLPALMIDGRPEAGVYKGRYAEGTQLSIAAGGGGAGQELVFEVNGRSVTNTLFEAGVTAPLDIQVTLP